MYHYTNKVFLCFTTFSSRASVLGGARPAVGVAPQGTGTCRRLRSHGGLLGLWVLPASLLLLPEDTGASLPCRDPGTSLGSCLALW